MRYIKDDGTIRKYLDMVLSKYKKTFKEHQKLNYLLVFFESKAKPGQTVVYGRTSLPGRKIKDLFGYDVIIEINRDEWRKLTKRQKKKLIFHELCHIAVKQTKQGEPRVALMKHDFELARFKKELTTFGLDADEESFRIFLNEVASSKKEKKKRRKSNET